MYEQSVNHISTPPSIKIAARKVTHWARQLLTNTRPHQLLWETGIWGTGISCTKCSQVAGLPYLYGMMRPVLATTRPAQCLTLHIWAYFLGRCGSLMVVSICPLTCSRVALGRCGSSITRPYFRSARFLMSP